VYDRVTYAQIRHPYFSAQEYYGGTHPHRAPEQAICYAIVRAAAEIGNHPEKYTVLCGQDTLKRNIDTTVN
jgi:hypothetical protein